MLFEGVVDNTMQDEARAGHLYLGGRVVRGVQHRRLVEPRDEAPLGLQRPALAAKVGAYDVDIAILASEAFGVIGSLGVAHANRVQALYLPVRFEVRAGTDFVADERETVKHFSLIQTHPERPVPTVLPEQLVVLDREHPRRLVWI